MSEDTCLYIACSTGLNRLLYFFVLGLPWVPRPQHIPPLPSLSLFPTPHRSGVERQRQEISYKQRWASKTLPSTEGRQRFPDRGRRVIVGLSTAHCTGCQHSPSGVVATLSGLPSHSVRHQLNSGFQQKDLWKDQTLVSCIEASFLVSQDYCNVLEHKR